MKTWLHNSLVALDVFVNVLAGGKPDETISARSQRAADRGNRFGKFMCWWLGKIQKDHGHRAEQGDLNRAEAVEKVEEGALGEK